MGLGILGQRLVDAVRELVLLLNREWGGAVAVYADLVYFGGVFALQLHELIDQRRLCENDQHAEFGGLCGEDARHLHGVRLSVDDEPRGVADLESRLLRGVLGKGDLMLAGGIGAGDEIGGAPRVFG